MAGFIDLEPIFDNDPDWAQKINSNFSKINAHDHGISNGTGISVNIADVVCISDLHFINQVKYTLNNIIYPKEQVFINNIGYIQFNNLLANVNSKNTLYIKGSEWFFSNGIGFSVQITNGPSLNALTIGGGGFNGNLSINGASVTFSSSTETYHFFGNSGSTTSIICGNIFATNLSVDNLSSINTLLLDNLTITNIIPMPVIPGTYILNYNGTSTLTPQNINLYPNNGTDAQIRIPQFTLQSTTQRFVDTTYSTNYFSYAQSMFYVNESGGSYVDFRKSYFIYPPEFNPDMTYQFGNYNTNELATEKGQGILFSIYDRDGNNFPPIIQIRAGVSTYIINNTYSSSWFTMLKWVNQRP